MTEVQNQQPPPSPEPQSIYDKKWSTAAKVTLVAGIIFTIGSATFFGVLVIHNANVKLFITQTIIDFVKNPENTNLELWQWVAIAANGVAVTSGVVTSGGLAYLAYKTYKANKKKIERQKAELRRHQEEAHQQQLAAQREQIAAKRAQEQAAREMAAEKIKSNRAAIQTIINEIAQQRIVAQQIEAQAMQDRKTADHIVQNIFVGGVKDTFFKTYSRETADTISHLHATLSETVVEKKAQQLSKRNIPKSAAETTSLANEMEQIKTDLEKRRGEIDSKIQAMQTLANHAKEALTAATTEMIKRHEVIVQDLYQQLLVQQAILADQNTSLPAAKEAQEKANDLFTQIQSIAQNMQIQADAVQETYHLAQKVMPMINSMAISKYHVVAATLYQEVRALEIYVSTREDLFTTKDLSLQEAKEALDKVAEALHRARDLDKQIQDIAKEVQQIDASKQEVQEVNVLGQNCLGAITHAFQKIKIFTLKIEEQEENRKLLQAQLSPKLLAFLHGDSFIEGSGYEGGHVVDNITFLLTYFKAKGEVPEKLQSLLPLLNDVCERNKQFPLPSALRNQDDVHQVQKYAEDLQNKINHLKEGERFIMKGGWASQGGGHALLYIIERTEQGGYAFTIVNTGSGIESHSSQIVGYKKKYKPIQRFHNIPKEKISNLHFLQSLLELQISSDDKNQDFQYKAEDVYRIIASLDSPRDVEYENRVDFITAQRSGTCSFKVLMKLLQIEIGDRKEFKELMFALKKYSLELFLQKAPQIAKEQNLLQLCKEGFARYVLKQYEKGYLSDNQLLEAKELVAKITAWLEIEETKKIQALGKEVDVNSNHPYTAKELQMPLNFASPVQGQAVVVNHLQNSPIYKYKIFPEDPEQMNQFLIEVCDYCDQLYQEENPRGIIQTLKDFVKLAPPHAFSNEGYWNKYCVYADKVQELERAKSDLAIAERGLLDIAYATPKEVEEMQQDKELAQKKIEKLEPEIAQQGAKIAENVAMITTTMEHYARLSKFLFTSIAGLHATQRGSPEQLALSSILFTTNLRLAQALDRHNYVDIKDLLQPSNNPFDIIHDKMIRKSFLEARDYLATTQKTTEVLGFNQDDNFLVASFKDNKSFWDKNNFLYKVVSDYYSSHAHAGHPITDYDMFLKVLPHVLEQDFYAPFRIILQQWILFSYLHHDPHLVEIVQKKGAMPGQLSFTFSEAAMEQEKYIYITTRIDNILIDFRKKKPLEKKKFSTHQASLVDRGFFNFAHDASPPGYISEGNPRPYNALLFKATDGFSTFEGHQMCSLFLSRRTFLTHLLSYLKEYPGKLCDRDFQIMVYLCLSREGVIEESLELFPELQSQLKQYLLELITSYEVSQDSKVQLYLIDILKLIDNTFDEREALQQVLQQIDPKEYQLKSLAYLQLIASYDKQETLSTEEISMLVSAYLHIQTYGYDSRFSYPHIKEKIDEMIHRIARDPLMKESATHDMIAREISTQILNMPKEQHWERVPDTLRFTAGSYMIDLNTFTIYDNGIPLGGIPSFLKATKDFQTLFGSKSFPSQEIAPNAYEFIFENRRYRVFSVPDRVIIIQRHEGGDEWSTYLSQEEMRNYTKVEALVQGNTHWSITEDEYDTSRKIMVEKGEMRIAEMTCILEQNGWKITQTRKHKENLQLQLPESSKIGGFQKEGFFLNWGNLLLEFPQAQMHFTVNAQDHKAYFSENRDYYLASTQLPPPLLVEYGSSIKLENRAGNHLFLFPREPISLSNQEESGAGAITKKMTIPFEKNDGRYFQLEESEGRLVGNTIEENLFLAYLHLGHKNYEEAYKLLASHRVMNPKGEYSSQEKEILNWIFDMIKSAKDPSHGACAIHLHLLYLCHTHFSEKEKQDFQLHKKLVGTLQRYYPMSHHLRSLAISIEQEIALLSSLSPLERTGIPGAEQRYKVLTKDVYQPSIPSEEPQYETIPYNINIKAFEKAYNEIERGWKETSYVFGKERLKRREANWQQEPPLMVACLSNDPNERAWAIQELSLLRISPEKDQEIAHFRNIMLFIAKHPHLAQNSQKLLYAIIKNAPSPIPTQFIQDINDLLDEIRALPADEEKDEPKVKVMDQEELPLVVEESSVVFAPTVSQTTPQSVIMLLEKRGDVHLEEAAIVPISRESVAALQNALSPNPDDEEVMQKEFVRVQRSIHDYVTQQNARKLWDYSSADALDNIHTMVESRKENLEKERNSLQQQLLILANHPPDDPAKAAIYAMQHLGKQRKELSLDDLIILFLQDNGKELAKRNPHLTESERQWLAYLVENYLLIATELSYLSRLEAEVTNAETATLENRTERYARLDATLKEERAYTLDEETRNKNRVLLVFEYYSEFRLRKEQVHLIQKLCASQIGEERRNIIAQLIMGSGKSKVILPLLANLLSDGENVPVIIAPDMLYETNLEDMRILSGENLHQRVHTIHLVQGETLTEDKLDEILDIIEQIKDHRSYALLSDSTVRELFLHFKESLVSLSHEKEISEATERRFRKLQTVINTLFDIAIIDEADMVLDYLKEMNFSSGFFQSIPQETQDIVESIFTRIATNEDLAKFFLINEESDTPFDRNKYELEIKPLLANILFEMTGLNEADKESIIAYLSGDPKLKKRPTCIEDLKDKKIKNLLAFGKEFLNTLGPYAIDKGCDHYFGLSRLHPTFRAIPFDAQNNVPREGSEFSSPFETMIFTTYYYTRKGITLTQMKTLLELCKTKARAEQKRTGCAITDTKGYQELVALFPNQKNPFTLQDEALAREVEEFNKDVKKLIAFSRNYGWREIGLFDQRLSSGAQHLLGLFTSVLGFTGTLWNADTFPSTLEAESDPLIDGKTLHLLAKSNPTITTHDQVKDLYASLKDYNACIDTGTWFKGIPARDVALEILRHLPPEQMDAVIYFNDIDIPPGSMGQAVVLERGKEKEAPKLFSKTHIPIERRFTYYNKTTGADILQHPQAKALMTVSKNMLLRDLVQGAWRLRGLDKEQKVDFAVLKECFVDKEEVHIGDIVRLGIQKQATRQCHDNPGALKKGIAYQAESVILQACKDPNRSIEEIQGLALSASSLLAPKVSMDLYELFGDIEQIVDMDTIIDTSISSTMDTLQVLYQQHENLQQVRTLQECRASMEKLVKKETLPQQERVKGTGDYGTEMQMQTQVAMQTQVELEVVQAQQEGRLTITPQKSWGQKQGLQIFSENFWNYDNPINKTRSVNSFLQSHAANLIHFDPDDPVFAEELQISQGYAFIERLKGNPVLFQSGTPPLYTCVLQYYSPEKMRLILIDPYATSHIAIILQEAKKYWADPELYLKEGKFKENTEIFTNQDFNLFLINPHAGMLSSGSEKMEEDVTRNALYVTLCAQAKFYNGNLDCYTKEECAALKEWIQEKGSKRMRLLLANILRIRPNDRARFDDSQLGLVFKEIEIAAEAAAGND